MSKKDIKLIEHALLLEIAIETKNFLTNYLNEHKIFSSYDLKLKCSDKYILKMAENIERYDNFLCEKWSKRNKDEHDGQ